MNDASDPRPRELNRVEAQGSHHDIGRALGRWGAEACHRHLVRSDAWTHIMACRDRPEIPAMRALLHRAIISPFSMAWRRCTMFQEGSL